ncbi:uncharacterized protein METZ01_LOCUS499025, partial [marine metagenome]
MMINYGTVIPVPKCGRVVATWSSSNLKQQYTPNQWRDSAYD